MKKSVVILIRNAAQTDFGGGERVPVFIARETLLQSNLSPIIFSSSEKLLDFAKINNIPFRKTWWWSRQDWSGPKVLLFPVYFIWQIILFVYYTRLFLKHRPIVVHLQSKDDFIAGTLAARLVGASVLWSDHSDLKHIFKNHKVWYKNPIGKLVYLAARFTEKIIVVSKEDMRLISLEIPDGLIRQKMEIVYNGAFDSYQPVEKNDIFTFISTGRLVTDKGIGELIEAFTRFHDEHNDSQLYLLGDGPERERFEKMASGNTAIHFLGYQKEPLKYVAESHVFLLPTYHEGFSLAIVEACMLAMPVIATNVGGNPEIIRDRETGLLVEVYDSITLQDAMEELYNNTPLREQLSKNARDEYEKKFNYKNIINDNYVRFYQDAL